MDEQWKPVVGWEGLYEVSSFGQVKSLSRTSTIPNRWGGLTTRTYPDKIMSQAKNKSEYFQVVLDHDGRRSREHVHRLLCRAFNGPSEDGRTHVAHWDGNGLNNHVDNLRWATPFENSQDRIRHERSCRGESHPSNVLTFETVKNIRATGNSETDAELAKKFGVVKTTIRDARLGKTWKWMNDV